MVRNPAVVFLFSTAIIETVCHGPLRSGVFVRGVIPHRYLALPMSSSTGRKQAVSLNEMFGTGLVVVLRAGATTCQMPSRPQGGR